MSILDNIIKTLFFITRTVVKIILRSDVIISDTAKAKNNHFRNNAETGNKRNNNIENSTRERVINKLKCNCNHR